MIPRPKQGNPLAVGSASINTAVKQPVSTGQPLSSSTISQPQASASTATTSSPTSSCKVNSRNHKRKIRRTTVIFGTSITKYVRAKNLGFRGRKVINISQSGAKIKDIAANVREFYENDIAAKNNDVEKIIFSLGTNDIKFSRSGVNHLKKYITELIDTTKNLFSHAIIMFQCCLPIKSIYPYVAANVVNFNSMINDLCVDYNCV